MEKSSILVWDLPVRVFHWLLAISFAGAFLTAESERYRDLHVLLGYTVLGLLAFRLLWAFAGSRYARLRSFAFGPKAVLAYLRSLLTGRPIHFVGHNPAGSWAIYAIVVLGLFTAVSGYAAYTNTGGELFESVHEGAANVMLTVVIVHVVGVLVSSFLHRENLVRAMVTGYKKGHPREGIAKTRWAAALALACGVVVLWSGVFRASAAPEPTSPHRATVTEGSRWIFQGQRERDDDD